MSIYFSLGEGNGNPLQCSCLENHRDGRAWWAAVYGVAQSRTRLKRLSSSSSTFLLLLVKFFFLITSNVSWGWSFEWTLKSDLLATWTWMSKSHQIWDLSGIISLSTICVPFSLSCPSGTPIMCRLFLRMLPQSSHRFFHSFLFLFFFVPWLGNLNGPAF